MTMRLFCISFALLLYANLTHAVELDDMYGSIVKNLAPAPVDNIEGSRCSDCRAGFINAPEELRDSDACKQDGLVKHSKYFMAVARKVDVREDTPNKTYMCCIDWKYVCVDTRGTHTVPMEVVSKKDENGKEQLDAVICSDSESCQNPKRNFCIQEAANNWDHYHRTDDAKLMENWKELPFCCPKLKQDECDYEKSDYSGVDSNSADCEKNFGRCKANDHTLLCSKKKTDEKASSCCKPYRTELCPFGFYPFGVKGKNGLVDWVAGNSGDVDAWKKACIDLGNTYISGDKCCAKAKLNEEANHGAYWSSLSDKYERLSTKGCKTDADCGESKFCGTVTSSHNNEPATGRACFEKIHCPHKSKTVYPVFSTDNPMTCYNSETCSNGTICIWGKSAAATAAKIKASKIFGMCCPKAAYEEEMCSADFLGDPLNKNTGLIVFSDILEKKDCQGALQKWRPLDTGGWGTGEDMTKVCCQYPPVQFDKLTCTAVIKGDRTITGMPIENANLTGRYVPCDKEKKRKAYEPKNSCGEKLGFCFTDPSKPEDFPGVCCDTELCPDGMTALIDVPVCDDNCIWKNSTEEDKYCVEDKKKIKKCCPKKPELSLTVDMICLFGSFLTSIAIVSLIYVICHVGAKWKTAKMAKKASMATTGGGKATGKGATTGH